MTYLFKDSLYFLANLHTSWQSCMGRDRLHSKFKVNQGFSRFCQGSSFPLPFSTSEYSNSLKSDNISYPAKPVSRISAIEFFSFVSPKSVSKISQSFGCTVNCINIPGVSNNENTYNIKVSNQYEIFAEHPSFNDRIKGVFINGGAPKLEYPRKCQKCGSVYSSRSSFCNHKKSCNKVKEQKISIKSTAVSKKSIDVSKYSCKLCLKSFPRKYNFNRHERICTGIKKVILYPRVCVKCKRVYKNKSLFFNHKNFCTSNPRKKFHPCPFQDCLSSFYYLGTLENHIKAMHKLETLDSTCSIIDESSDDISWNPSDFISHTVFKPLSNEQKTTSVKDLCFELIELMKDQNIQNKMSSKVETVLKALVSSCQDVVHLRKISSEESFTSEVTYQDTCQQTFCSVNIYNLDYVAIKSLDPFISNEEVSFCKSLAPHFVKGQLYDKVIDAFLFKLCSKDPEFTLIDSSVAHSLNTGCLEEKLFVSAIVLLPICLDEHWALIVLYKELMVVELYDPQSNDIGDKYLSIVMNLINSCLWVGLIDTWQLKVHPHILQQDIIDCGVFICFYAHQVVCGSDLINKFNSVLFRKYMFRVIMYDESFRSFFENEQYNPLLYKEGHSYFKFNEINSENINECVLCINNTNITNFMLKSLDLFISQDEEELLKTFNNSFCKGWLYDSIIDTFLFKCCSVSDSFVSVDSVFSLNLVHDRFNNCSWISDIHKCKLLFIPINLNNHWVLIIVDIRTKTFEFYDPSSSSIDSQYSSLLQKWCDLLKKLLNLNNSDKWKITVPPHVTQKDIMSCGVFICYYTYQKVNFSPLVKDFNLLCFRKYIYDTIVK